MAYKDPNSGTQRRIATRTKDTLSPKMLDRRNRFIQGLLQGMSKKAAAEFSGVKPCTSHREGCEMFNEPYVQEEFRRLREAMSEEELLTRKELLLNVKGIAFDDYEKGSSRVAASTMLAKFMGWEKSEDPPEAPPTCIMLIAGTPPPKKKR